MKLYAHLLFCYLYFDPLVLTHPVIKMPPKWNFCESLILIDKGLYDIEKSLYLWYVLLNVPITAR